MKCSEFYLDDPNETCEDWLGQLQFELSKKWTTTTKHQPGATGNTWACEIYHGCNTCHEHLSLPCSLLAEANEIGAFLNAPCYSDEPSTFLRFYLIILSEFTSQLAGGSKLIGLPPGGKPRELSIWANRWAKHRLQILLQHHPLIAFADAYGSQWPAAEKRLRTELLIDSCGNSHTSRIIDTIWLKQDHDHQPHPDANGPGRAIIIVPPMMTFLEEVIRYFRQFVDACLKVPDRIRAFESSSFVVGC